MLSVKTKKGNGFEEVSVFYPEGTEDETIEADIASYHQRAKSFGFEVVVERRKNE